MKTVAENEDPFGAADFTDVEIGAVAKAEYDRAILRLVAFISGELEQNELLERELDDELNHLLLTLRKGKPDPPGWPDF
jgi:hypothetical protein